MIYHTAPELLAASRGKLNRGPHRCFYCGAPCGEDYAAAEWVKESFTSRDTICGGGFVCSGCTIALDERAVVEFNDGTRREGQKTRCYSWFLTPAKAIAATKAHLEWLRGLCLDPPEPPFSLVLSESGQKHLLYRGVVCNSLKQCVVTLEGERVDFTPEALRDRLLLCRKLIAATGKPALAEPLSPNSAMRIIAHHHDDALPYTWNAVREQPLSRLAAWLAPAKEVCLVEFPSAVA
jgi:hypothetical protein